MKFNLFIIASLIPSLYLTGCANNDMNNEVATRQRNATDITRVNYNPHQVGPAISSADTSDPELDRTRKHNNRNNVGNNNPTNTRLADKAVDKVINLSEVDDAVIIVNDNNAYILC